MKEPNLKDLKQEDVIYLCNVICSCKTQKQLVNAWFWASNLLREWEKYDASKVWKTGIAIEWLSFIRDKYNEPNSLIQQSYYKTLQELNPVDDSERDEMA